MIGGGRGKVSGKNVVGVPEGERVERFAKAEGQVEGVGKSRGYYGGCGSCRGWVQIRRVRVAGRPYFLLFAPLRAPVLEPNL